MLFAISALKGYAVAATDDRIGSVKDFLFDDRTWRVRWMVVDTGHWLPGRKVLIHPSAIAPLEVAAPAGDRLRLMSFGPDLVVSVKLTRAQIEASPDIREDEPVSAQMETLVSDYYGWSRMWGTSYFGTNAITTAVSPPPLLGSVVAREMMDIHQHVQEGDADLRSVAEVRGYHVHAGDGDIGHVENFLADDGNWDIRYLIVATRNWWPGRHVLLAPYTVAGIDWKARRIALNVSRRKVRESPPWDAAKMVDLLTEQQLHGHYGWPGYGW